VNRDQCGHELRCPLFTAKAGWTWLFSENGPVVQTHTVSARNLDDLRKQVHMVKRTAALLACAATGVALALAMASPATAAAATHEMYTSDGGTHGGKVTFTEHGDIVTLCDRDADGHFVSLYVNSVESGHGSGYLISTEGHQAGYCKTVRASNGGEYDLSEYITYKFEIDLSNNTGYRSALWHNDN
jgi:hypothetical protein